MAAVPCTSFTPVVLQGRTFCARCGLFSEFHQQQPQQHQQYYNGGQAAMFQPNWQNPQVEQYRAQAPLPAPHAYVTPLDPHQPHYYQQPAYHPGEIRYRSFSPYQVQCMLNMADAIGWTLRGRTVDGQIDQLCQEIGVVKSQFANFMTRHRRRFVRRN